MLYPETFLPHSSIITKRVLPPHLKWNYSYLTSWQIEETSAALWPKHLNSRASYSLAEVWNLSVILCGIIPSPNLVLKMFLWGETFHVRDACKIGNWNGHQWDSLEPHTNLLRNGSCQMFPHQGPSVSKMLRNLWKILNCWREIGIKV